MDETDIGFGLGILLILITLFYGSYRWGMYHEFKLIEQYLPKAFEATYWDGYDDGKKTCK